MDFQNTNCQKVGIPVSTLVRRGLHIPVMLQVDFKKCAWWKGSEREKRDCDLGQSRTRSEVMVANTGGSTYMSGPAD